MTIGSHSFDPRRPDRIKHYKEPVVDPQIPQNEIQISDLFIILGVLFCTFAYMMRQKWCAWMGLYCFVVSSTNMRTKDDIRQLVGGFMISILAIMVLYIHDPRPMTISFNSF